MMLFLNFLPHVVLKFSENYYFKLLFCKKDFFDLSENQVYSPWCIDCETTSKQMKKLAKHFKGLDSLTIARIDASANEHPKLQVITINSFMILI